MSRFKFCTRAIHEEPLVELAIDKHKLQGLKITALMAFYGFSEDKVHNVSQIRLDSVLRSKETQGNWRFIKLSRTTKGHLPPRVVVGWALAGSLGEDHAELGDVCDGGVVSDEHWETTDILGSVQEAVFGS